MSDTGFDEQSAIEALIAQMPEQYRTALSTVFSASNGFKDRTLKQQWDIATGEQSGANKRANISANASLQEARMSAKTARRGQDIQQENNRGQLGLGYLDTASKLRGPADFFQAADFNRGASQRQDVPVFVKSLMDNVGMPSFQAPGGMPAGVTAQGMLSQLTGGTPAPGAAPGAAGTDQNAMALAGIRGLAKRGYGALGGGALESLSPSELGLLKSGSEYSGDGGPAWNMDDLMSQYKGSRVSQGSARAA